MVPTESDYFIINYCISLTFEIIINMYRHYLNNKTVEKLHFLLNRFSTASVEAVKLVFQKYPTENATAPPVLVFHGLYGSKRNFQTFCWQLSKMLAPKRVIYCVDMRNHGDSPHSVNHTIEHLAEDIKLLCADLNLPKVSLLGHSLGGLGVLYFAVKYEEFADKIIIVDISHAYKSRNSGNHLEVFKILKNVELPHNEKSLMKAMKIISKQLEPYFNTFFRNFIVTNIKRRASDGKLYWALNLDALMAEVKKFTKFPDVSDKTFLGPIMFVAGANSDYLTEKDEPSIYKLCPHAEIVYIEDSHHLVHIEKPREFLSVCSTFLNS